MVTYSRTVLVDLYIHCKLNENLSILRAASTEFQQSLISSRISKEKEAVQNRFQEGDLVLFDAGPKPHPKMASRHKGPYEVIRHNKRITCHNLFLQYWSQYVAVYCMYLLRQWHCIKNLFFSFSSTVHRALRS
jgi:hypothetical protein